MTARERAIELMRSGEQKYWDAYAELGESLATEIHTPMGSALDALLSDAGRPLVEYLKDRGVLMHHMFNGLGQELFRVRLPEPGETS